MSCSARSPESESNSGEYGRHRCRNETSQSFVARLESTAADARSPTVDRYAETLGYVVRKYHLIPAEDGADRYGGRRP